MASTFVTITVDNPITGEQIDGVDMQLFYSIHFDKGRRIVYVNGTATVELDESNAVVAKNVLPYATGGHADPDNVITAYPVEGGPTDPSTDPAVTV